MVSTITAFSTAFGCATTGSDREAKMQFDPTFYGGHEIYDDLNDKSWWDGCFVSTNMVYCFWLRDYGKA